MSCTHRALADDEYQEAAAAAMLKRNKQIEDASLGRLPAGTLTSLEPMPTPPSE
jgi:hypothetical protein